MTQDLFLQIAANLLGQNYTPLLISDSIQEKETITEEHSVSEHNPFKTC